MIEVILRQDVEHLGRRGDVVKVAPGYARNYLLPRKLALAVTEGNRRQIEHERKLAAVREAEDRTAAQTAAQRLTQALVVIARKVGETETLYGSVTAVDIAEALAAQQIEVDRRKIQLDEPLKHLGEFAVPVKLHRDVVAQLRVQVVRDEA
jgi:large subunit ribosomal protein L9